LIEGATTIPRGSTLQAEWKRWASNLYLKYFIFLGRQGLATLIDAATSFLSPPVYTLAEVLL